MSVQTWAIQAVERTSDALRVKVMAPDGETRLTVLSAGEPCGVVPRDPVRRQRTKTRNGGTRVTFDHFTSLLAVLVWPFVALVAAWTAQRVAWTLAASWRETAEFVANHLTAAARALPSNQQQRVADRLVLSAEASMLMLLQTNGAYPKAPNDKTGRAIVRELREMYSEIQRATSAPDPQRSVIVADPYEDDLTLDEPDGDGAGDVEHVYAEHVDLEEDEI